MKNVEILDCTLRDGGRLFNCEFSDEMIADMVHRLQNARIDIIEVGFLRDDALILYSGNSTFFTKTKQISKFLPKNGERKSIFTAFIDYGLFDFDLLEENDGKTVDGIRFGFTKKNLKENEQDIIRCMKIVKDKGYKLFVQNVNTPGYSDGELLRLIDAINEVMPYSYGIVDTYGSMYEDDLGYYFYMINKNLDEKIRIDFHSHNNYQMSFALAQKIIKFSKNGQRRVIIDGTLNGMGKGAGNLNIELIVDWLVRKKNYNYEFNEILDLIDDYCKEIRKRTTWGYSLPGLFSGIYRCHPNNMIYLTEKFDLSSKDIRTILSSVDPEKRERYDYDNLQRVCTEYNNTKIDDRDIVESLKRSLEKSSIMLIMPGTSINNNGEHIKDYVEKNNAILISVNFLYEYIKPNMVFFGSVNRYRKYRQYIQNADVIITSNIKTKKNDIRVNYEELVERGNIYFDNSTIMCLNLLRKCDVKEICLAGFDGYADNSANYSRNNDIQSDLILGESKQINNDVQDMFSRFCQSVLGQINIKMLTPSVYKIPEP